MEHPPAQEIATVALIVRDYDEALAWYTGVIGFDCIEDTDLGPKGGPGP